MYPEGFCVKGFCIQKTFCAKEFCTQKRLWPKGFWDFGDFVPCRDFEIVRILSAKGFCTQQGFWPKGFCTLQGFWDYRDIEQEILCEGILRYSRILNSTLKNLWIIETYLRYLNFWMFMNYFWIMILTSIEPSFEPFLIGFGYLGNSFKYLCICFHSPR